MKSITNTKNYFQFKLQRLKKIIFKKEAILFAIKFLLLFFLFYYGTKLIIGLSYEEGIYYSFVHDYLDYISVIKRTLMFGAKVIAGLFGYTTNYEPNFLIRVINKRGVIISQGCVGYGVMSFWLAYVLSNQAKTIKKMVWALFGLLIIWLINSIRIGLFLVAINKGWEMPLGIDHHTWFNIFAYIGIFILIYFFEKSIQKNES